VVILVLIVFVTGRGTLRTVKAGMRAGKSILIAVILVDVELGDAVHAFKIGEPVKWCFACSGHKLQELGTFLARESGDGTGEKKRGLVL
jgi:hypothetical protein